MRKYGAENEHARAAAPAPLHQEFEPERIEQHFRRYQASGCKEQLFRAVADHYVESLLAAVHQLRAALTAERDRRTLADQRGRSGSCCRARSCRRRGIPSPARRAARG